jgi:hypothetical protein
MVELIDADRYTLDEKASGLSQPDAPSAVFKKKDAKFFLQSLYPRTHTGLADT